MQAPQGGVQPKVEAPLAPAPPRPLPTPDQLQREKAALLTPGDTPENTIPARWRRRRPPMNAMQKAEADQQAHLAELQAHFAEAGSNVCGGTPRVCSHFIPAFLQVDALELAVETPTPPGKVVLRQSGGGWAVDRSRPMSLGLSSRLGVPAQRLSMLPSRMVSPSPLRISLGPQGALRKQAEIPAFKVDCEDAAEETGGDGGRAVGHRSSMASMLGRLSLRDSDAVEHCSSTSASADVAKVEQRQGEGPSRAAAAGVSPIKEEEDEGTSDEKEGGCLYSAAAPQPSAALAVDLREEGPAKRVPSLEGSSANDAAAFSTLSPLNQLVRLCGQEVRMRRVAGSERRRSWAPFSQRN